MTPSIPEQADHRQIVCEEWHRAVREFGLTPNSVTEAVVSRILGRFADMPAVPPLGTVGRETKEQIVIDERFVSIATRAAKGIERAERLDVVSGQQIYRTIIFAIADAILSLRPALPVPAGWQETRGKLIDFLLRKDRHTPASLRARVADPSPVYKEEREIFAQAEQDADAIAVLLSAAPAPAETKEG